MREYGGGTTGGTISGTVTSTESGTAISGASIVLIERPEYSAKTNAQGQYSISRVPVGTYTVKASKTGYTSQQASAQVTSGQTTTKNFSLTPSSVGLVLKSWEIDDIDGKGMVSPGDHGTLRLTFHSSGGIGLNIYVTLDASSTGGRIFFKNPSNPSQWLRTVTLTIASVLPGVDITVSNEIYFERFGIDEFPSGNLLPKDQKFKVTWLTGSEIKTCVFQRVSFVRLNLPPQYALDLNMLEEDCNRHPQSVTIGRYAQYGVADSDVEAAPTNDPDTREQAMWTLAGQIHLDYKYNDTWALGPLRQSDLDLIKKRPPDKIGQCIDYTDFSAGLLRSLGLQSRDVFGRFKNSQKEYNHAWNEVLINSGGTQDSWWHFDACHGVTNDRYRYAKPQNQNWGQPVFVFADLVPLTNTGRHVSCHDTNIEGIWGCDPRHQNCFDCNNCTLSPICSHYQWSEEVTSRYRWLGKTSPIPEKYVLLNSHTILSLTALAPVKVVRDSSFDLVAILANLDDSCIYHIGVSVQEKIWGSDTLDTYQTSNPEVWLDSLPAGSSDTVSWVVTPLLSGHGIPLSISASDSVLSFYNSAVVVQNVNEPGTPPDLILNPLVTPKVVEPSGSVDFLASVLDDSLRITTDASVKVRVESEMNPGYLDSLSLVYSSADSAYLGSLIIPSSAPLGDYKCFIKCSKTGFDSDSQSTYFSVKPLLSLVISTDDSVYDCRDTVSLSAILQDRGDTVCEAVLEANVRTSLGDHLIPMESDSTYVYHSSFVPASLVPYFGDTTLADGMWDLVVTTDYYGSASADTARVRVKVPDLSVTATDIIFSPSEPDTGENVLISAKVRNIGTAVSDSSILCFYVDQLDSSAQIGADYELPVLQINDSATISFMWNTEGLSGTHTIYVQVDPDRISIDSRRFNNAASTTVYIGSYIHGDVNGDGVIALGDVVYLITYLYKNGPAPNPVLAGDANCNGEVNLGDLVYLITYLYKSGPPPSCK